ncbi:hypothetical protein [Poseidonocella sp. HB161398]|uniref:hypothetical protein n=1 Tax=Poseidonocella sp. HB161398 TaxID=2320855 RepID=UPI001107E2FF|nr:hypothetical protein [Poseidonocella sp. HB161398]
MRDPFPEHPRPATGFVLAALGGAAGCIAAILLLLAGAGPWAALGAALFLGPAAAALATLPRPRQRAGGRR